MKYAEFASGDIRDNAVSVAMTPTLFDALDEASKALSLLEEAIASLDDRTEHLRRPSPIALREEDVAPGRLSSLAQDRVRTLASYANRLTDRVRGIDSTLDV